MRPSRYLRRCAVVLALMALHGVAAAQDNEEKEKPAGGIGGLFASIGKGVGGLFQADSGKPIIATLKAGPYAASNEAIGEERDVEARRLENYGLVPIKAYQEYANAIYGRLKELSGVTGLPGSVYLIATNEMVATSSPDGNLFMSVAWVNSIESEDELAALLAHELSHVLLHHHDSTVISNAQKQLQYVFAVGSGLKNSLDKLDQSSGKSLSPGQLKALERMQLLVSLTDKVMLPAWTRSQETDADRLATDLLFQAGYSVTGMTDFLGRIKAWDNKQAERRKQKEEEIQAEMQTLVNAGGIDAAMKLGLNEGAKGLLDTLSRQHESGDQRLEEFTAYRELHHPDWPRVVIRKDAYAKVLADRAVKPVLDAYAATFKAIVAEEQGRFDDAYRMLLPVTKPGAPGDGHAMPNFELYRAMERLGRKNALAQLVKSYRAAEPSWKPYAEAIRLEARQGHRPQALQVVKEARARFKDAPALTPKLVEVYAELGFNEELQQELIVCNSVHVMYRELCQQKSKR